MRPGRTTSLTTSNSAPEKSHSAANVKRVQAWVTKAPDAEWARIEEGVRVALQWAWDEQTDAFFPLLTP